MKKAKWIVLAIAVFCVVGWIVGKPLTRKTEIRQIVAERFVLAESVSEMQEISDLIVVATPTDKNSTVLSLYSDGNVSFGYTKTEVFVSKVLKGDVAEGTTIVLTEECYHTSDGTLWTQQGYLPMEEGHVYLLFLSDYPEESSYHGMYFPIELEYGKYLIDVGDDGSMPVIKDRESLELGDEGNLERYWEWRQEVVTLYPEVFDS